MVSLEGREKDRGKKGRYQGEEEREGEERREAERKKGGREKEER